VRELACPDCATRVGGEFGLCPVCSLPDEDRALLELFLRVRGNAKGVERALGVSYPTVRARLEQLWRRLDAHRDAAREPVREVEEAVRTPRAPRPAAAAPARNPAERPARVSADSTRSSALDASPPGAEPESRERPALEILRDLRDGRVGVGDAVVLLRNRGRTPAIPGGRERDDAPGSGA
jgi:hypothetical protein